MIEQEQERTFFEKVGRAFREWALVEMQFFRTYARLVGTSTAQTNFLVKRAALKHRQKLVCDAVHSLRPELESEWVTICRKLGELGEQRNKLAHWTTYFGVGDLSGKGPWLGASYFHPDHDPNVRVHIADIERTTAEFHSLAGEIRRFADTRLSPPPDGTPLV